MPSAVVKSVLIVAHGVEYQPLIGLEHLAGETGVVHGELHAQFVEPHARTRPLAVEGERHFGCIGEIEGQVIRTLRADPRANREHALGRFAEGDRDDALTLGHALARAQEERHAGPAPIVDHAFERDEGLGIRHRIDAILLPVAAILPAHDVARIEHGHRAEDLVLLLADGAGFERGRRLHRHEAEDLEQVRDDHVAEGAGLLVKRGAAAETERFRHVDLHVIDEIAVPDRLEETVGEAEGEDVLSRFLAEEVVDAEDLVFAKTSWMRLLSALADARSVPKGFSMMTRERSMRPASASMRTAERAAFGGTLR